MNFRSFLPATLIFSLVISLVPTHSYSKDPDLKQILLYGGACIAGIGVINIAQNRTKSGLSLVAIGAIMAGAAKPEQVQRMLGNVSDTLEGKSKAERFLGTTQHNAQGVRSWWLNWVNS